MSGSMAWGTCTGWLLFSIKWARSFTKQWSHKVFFRAPVVQALSNIELGMQGQARGRRLKRLRGNFVLRDQGGGGVSKQPRPDDLVISQSGVTHCLSGRSFQHKAALINTRCWWLTSIEWVCPMEWNEFDFNLSFGNTCTNSSSASWQIEDKFLLKLKPSRDCCKRRTRNRNSEAEEERGTFKLNWIKRE